jgi:putative hydrolase of HD superfamily
MKSVLNFLIDIGKLKGKKRRGWLIHQITDAETTGEHIFHLALLVWVLGKNKKINLERAIQMALVHDLCEVYAPDITPYDPLLPKDKKGIMKALKKWPNFTPALKRKKDRDKHRMELHALNKLIANLPANLKNEIKCLWLDYENGLTPEARFVKQADKTINFFQGIDYWKKNEKIQHHLWSRWIKEIIDDPDLLEFIKVLEKKFYRKSKKRKVK